VIHWTLTVDDNTALFCSVEIAKMRTMFDYNASH